MQYAYLDGTKSEARKGAKGVCIGCKKEVIAKCGAIKLHHWAHAVQATCDSWWENETQWHRDWKDRFPEAYREVAFYDAAHQEYHRADIHTKDGITIEFQNSPLSTEELASRNKFYKKIIWVVNGAKFKGFSIAKNIPDPNDPMLAEYELKGRENPLYVRRSMLSKKARMIAVLSMQHSELRQLKVSNDHYSFSWKHAHSGWFSSSAPVFVDLGGHFLYWLRIRKQEGEDFWYLKSISKENFLEKYIVR
jgi:competence protein CoiA